MPIAFEELEGSPTLRLAAGELVGQRVFKVAWADRLAAVAELWGSYHLVGTQLDFREPAQFPDVPSLVASDVRVEPLDPRSPLGQTALFDFSHGTSAYAHAKLTVTYHSFPPAAPEGDPPPGRLRLPRVPRGTLLTFSADLAAEYVTLPGRNWKWNISGTPPLADDLAPGILVPCADVQLSWRRVPLPPWAAIRELRGKVNDAAFLDHQPGTVLFLGAKARRDFQLVDTGLWRLDYHFKVREVKSTVDGTTPLGWNYFYRQAAASGEHWLPIVDADGNPPYRNGDFDALFEFA